MEKKVITVGLESGDLTGNNQLPIQAAIDYLSYIGGGTVKVGEGLYNIESAIHLRSNVNLEGVEGKTIFRKCDEVYCSITADADLHQSQITVCNPDIFDIGQTVTIKLYGKDKGFADTVAVIVGKEGNVCYLDRELQITHLLSDNPIATANFPVISGYDCENVCVRNIVIDGNKENNSFVGGCRNAGIYLFHASNVTIEHCVVHDYNSDGISYQHCRNINVKYCDCLNNEGKGFHPGSGTTGTLLSHCKAIGNAMDGIFFCWRVTQGITEHCISTHNKMSGFSIGHKDVNNIIRNNNFSDNEYYGMFFRNEPDPMGANYNLVENNIIKDNGSEKMGYAGIRMRGSTNHVTIRNNKIIFEKKPLNKTVGICMEEMTHDIILEGNEFVNCKKDTSSSYIID